MTSPARAPERASDAGTDLSGGTTVSGARRWLPLLMTAVVAAVLAFVPISAGSHLTALIGRYLLLGVLAMSLDLLWGYTGQLSLGHAAFFGLGAYGAGLILASGEGVGVSYLALAVGVLLPAAAGLIMGVLLFRGGVSGVYFAIVTLLVSLLLEQLAISSAGFTGGINGLFGMSPLDLGFVRISSLESAYYLVLIVAVAAFLLCRWLVGTVFGRAMVAIRSNEARAESLGYPAIAIKTAVLVISCALAGIAGVLYVPLERFVYPTQLGLVASTGVIVWVVIGGRGTLLGAFLGVFTLEYLASALSGRLQEYWVLITGLILIAVVLTLPGGLLSLLSGASSMARSTLRRGMRRA